jgi:hypothetical protein
MLAGHLDRLDESSVARSNEEDSSNNGSRSNIDSSLSDSNVTGTTLSPKESAEVEIIANIMSNQVFWLKMTVLFVLFGATIVVAAAIYLGTQRSEANAFEASFNEDAEKVFDTFTFNVERKLGALDAFSVAITSLAADTGAAWPNFTMPDFEFRAANALELVDAASITLLPYVDADSRLGWEAYSVENVQWVQDSLAFQETVVGGRKLSTPTIQNGIADRIYLLEDGKKKVDETPGPYFPMWQHYPAIPDIVNYDLFLNDNFHDGILDMYNHKEAVLSKIWDLGEANEVFVNFLEAWEAESGSLHDLPVSKLFYPVFDSLNADHEIVAMLAAVVNWKTYFEQVLPPHAIGLIVVLRNECDQEVTYRIDGEAAFFLGKGDLHDTQYDYLGQTRKFSDLIKPNDRRIERLTDVNLDTDYCPYTLAAYPSEDLEDLFVTNNAVIYTVSVVIIFFFTGAMFLLYDGIVQRRQKMVMKRAVQSRAIVSSLFPAAVRDRLFRNEDSTTSKSQNDGNAKGFKKRGDGATKTRLKSLLHDTNPQQEQKPAHELRPIADLFPHTTVMFADIAGFTRWSSGTFF